MVWFFFVFKLKSLNANASAISYLWLQFSFYCLVCCQWNLRPMYFVTER